MYLLDSNTFIEGARPYYNFELAPGFWEWLVSDPMKDIIGSVESVKNEITAGHGDLVTWAQHAPDYFWQKPTAGTVDQGILLAEWAADPGHAYTQAAVDEFLSEADFWIIAEAMASGATVVTREKSEPNSKKIIKIPDACSVFGVDCAQPFPVFTELGLRLG